MQILINPNMPCRASNVHLYVSSAMSYSHRLDCCSAHRQQCVAGTLLVKKGMHP